MLNKATRRGSRRAIVILSAALTATMVAVGIVRAEVGLRAFECTGPDPCPVQPAPPPCLPCAELGKCGGAMAACLTPGPALFKIAGIRSCVPSQDPTMTCRHKELRCAVYRKCIGTVTTNNGVQETICAWQGRELAPQPSAFGCIPGLNPRPDGEGETATPLVPN